MAFPKKTFYYWLRKIRQKVCEQRCLPEATSPSKVYFWSLNKNCSACLTGTNSTITLISVVVIKSNGGIIERYFMRIATRGTSYLKMLPISMQSYNCLLICNPTQKRRWAVYDYRIQILFRKYIETLSSVDGRLSLRKWISAIPHWGHRVLFQESIPKWCAYNVLISQPLLWINLSLISPFKFSQPHQQTFFFQNCNMNKSQFHQDYNYILYVFLLHL